MTDYSPPPDVVEMLVAFLPTDEALHALIDERISTKLPTDFIAEPRVQLFRFGGAPVDGETEAIDRPLVQVNTFGATKHEAFQVAQAVTVAMMRSQGFQHNGGLIYGAERLNGPQDSPDPATDIPRWITTFALVTRTVTAP